jgi:hypothetical protein
MKTCFSKFLTPQVGMETTLNKNNWGKQCFLLSLEPAPHPPFLSLSPSLWVADRGFDSITCQGGWRWSQTNITWSKVIQENHWTLTHIPDYETEANRDSHGVHLRGFPYLAGLVGLAQKNMFPSGRNCLHPPSYTHRQHDGISLSI